MTAPSSAAAYLGGSFGASGLLKLKLPANTKLASGFFFVLPSRIHVCHGTVLSLPFSSYCRFTLMRVPCAAVYGGATTTVLPPWSYCTPSLTGAPAGTMNLTGFNVVL